MHALRQIRPAPCRPASRPASVAHRRDAPCWRVLALVLRRSPSVLALGARVPAGRPPGAARPCACAATSPPAATCSPSATSSRGRAGRARRARCSARRRSAPPARSRRAASPRPSPRLGPRPVETGGRVQVAVQRAARRVGAAGDRGRAQARPGDPATASTRAIVAVRFDGDGPDPAGARRPRRPGQSPSTSPTIRARAGSPA